MTFSALHSMMPKILCICYMFFYASTVALGITMSFGQLVDPQLEISQNMMDGFPLNLVQTKDG